MADQPTAQLKQALTELSTKLDDAGVKKAIGCIPDSVKTPVIDALKQVLNVIKQTLKDFEKELDCITGITPLFDVVNNLVDAAKGLVPGEEGKANLEKVKDVFNTLKDIPSTQDITDIVTLIDAIVEKLGKM